MVRVWKLWSNFGEWDSPLQIDVTDALSDWPAVRKWTGSKAIEYLSAASGNGRVQV